MTALAPCTIVITGPSAAGKSTVGRLLAQQFERGVHLEGDWFRRSVVAGRADMTPEPGDEALAQLLLRYELSAVSTESYRRAGFGVVVEDVVAGRLLHDYLDLFTTRPIRLFVLMPSMTALEQRERDRSAAGYDHWSMTGLYQLFDRDTPRLGEWIDSSPLTPQQTVEVIVQRVQRA